MNIKRGRGQPKLNLSEAQIRYAMANTTSNLKAAEWLRVDIFTYKKYAKLYIDPDTGKNLYDLHLSEQARKAYYTRLNPPDPTLKSTKMSRLQVTAPLDDIFAGKHPNYSRKKLINRMIKEGMLAECCDNCGYSTKREFDFKIPLKLWYRDNDTKNLAKDNIRLLCFNCFYLLAFAVYPDLQDLHKVNILKRSY